MPFDPDSISQDQLHTYRQAAERAWADDTRHPTAQGHPLSAYGQCYVTSNWLKEKLGGHVAQKDGHYFWASPDKHYVIDLTGDMTHATPHQGPNVLLDHEDEPYDFEPEQLRHRPGPIVYTHADHPLYKDFRIREFPDHPRAKTFSRRANAALEGKLSSRISEFFGDSFPGEQPQSVEDFNQRYFHDIPLTDLQLTTEEPSGREYRWFMGNGQLHVSPLHTHEELRGHSGVPANHSGPVAVGHVHVQGGNAIWSVESNMALRGLSKELRDYSKTVGWKWGGLVGGDGEQISDDFGPKKSYWFRCGDRVQISEQPFYTADGSFVVEGRTAFLPRAPKPVREGLREWADDFGYRIAEYPGGTEMTDRVKNKEELMVGDLGNPETEPTPAFDGVPQGELTCPHCKTVLPDFAAFLLHTKEHENPQAEEIPDGHFPTIEPLDEPLGLRNQPNITMPLASVRDANGLPEFIDFAEEWGDRNQKYYGLYAGGQLVAAASVAPHEPSPWKVAGEHGCDELEMVYSAAPGKGYGTALCRYVASWHPNLITAGLNPTSESMLRRAGFIEVQEHVYRIAAGQEGKDILQAPVPFVYDIGEDSITVGHPGQSTHEVPGQFTPGGIVEGVYEPGGKIVLRTTTSQPFTIYHMVQVWYYQHPQLEVTSVEMESGMGEKQKLAATNIGSYIKTLVASDSAAYNADQALKKAGGQTYVVGGAVRDALLQKEPKDVDMMVGGLPSETVDHVLKSLPGGVKLTGQRFGVYRYYTKGHEVEIALPRTDTYEEGGRRGTGKIDVDPNLPVDKDLERRDFTANAMAVDLNTGHLVDPFGGAQDIEHNTLRTTHPNSFNEDPTRLVRALAMHSKHGLLPDERTRQEMAQNAWRLDEESPDALRLQLEKLITSPNPAAAVRLAHETGVLRHMFPELEENFDYDQKNPFHNYTLGEHTLAVLGNAARLTKKPHVRLAALLHDIGKPASAWEDPVTGMNHYYPKEQPDGTFLGSDHAAVGATMAEARLRATYNWPRAELQKVHNLIANHMWGDFTSEKGARRFLQTHGDATDDLLTLREADSGGKGGGISPEDHQMLETQRHYIEQARMNKAPTQQSMISVNGNDLQELGVKPGPQIGQILRQLTNDVVEDPSLNDRSRLLERAKEYINAQP